MKISKNCVASFDYTLKDGSGNVIDTSEGRSPLAYIHGLGHIIPGLEAKMEGKVKGDKFSVSIEAKDAYGEKLAELVQEVPRDQFPDGDKIEVGMQFQVDTPDGPHVVSVTNITTDTVTVDGNHPLAGVQLHFSVEVMDVRTATAEELAHGHAHGPGGHHH